MITKYTYEPYESQSTHREYYVLFMQTGRRWDDRERLGMIYKKEHAETVIKALNEADPDIPHAAPKGGED